MEQVLGGRSLGGGGRGGIERDSIIHTIPPDDDASDENDLDLDLDLRTSDLLDAKRVSSLDFSTDSSAAAAMSGLGSSGPGPSRDRSDSASASASSARRTGSVRRGSDGTASASGHCSHPRRPRFGRAPDSGLPLPRDSSQSDSASNRNVNMGEDGDSATATTRSSSHHQVGAGAGTAAAAAPGGGLLGLSSFRTGGGLLSGAGAGAGASTAAAAAGASGGGLGSGLGLTGAGTRYGGGGLGLQTGRGPHGAPSGPPTSVSYQRGAPPRKEQDVQTPAQAQDSHHPQQQPQAKQQPQQQQQQPQQGSYRNLPGIRVARRTSELSMDDSVHSDGSAGSDLSMASASASAMDDQDDDQERKVPAHASHAQAQAQAQASNSNGRPHPAHQAGSAYLSRLLAAKQKQGTNTNTGSGGGGRGLGLGLGVAPVGGGGFGGLATGCSLPAFGRGAAKAKAAAAAAAPEQPPNADDEQQQQQQQQQQAQPVRAYDLFNALEANVLGGRKTDVNRRSSEDSGGSSGSLPMLEASTIDNNNAASAMGSSSSAQKSVLALRRRGHNSAAPATGQQGSTFATNTPAQPAATFHRRRPRKATSAYTYFFREKCKELAQPDGYDEYAAAGWRPGKKRASQTEGDGRGSSKSSPDAPEKRQRSNIAGESIDASPTPTAGVPAEEMGKIAAQQWRTMSSFEKAKYEEMAERDAERYQEEVEEYYKGSNGAVAASMLSGRAGGHPLLRISAGGDGGGSAAQASPFARAAAADAMTDLVATNSRSGVTTSVATANNPRKTALQQMLAAKRSELLNDISSLNEISSSRTAAGRPALQQNAEVRQRLYNLAVGPGGSAAAGPSTWNRARLTAGGVVTPTDGSPRTSIGGLATGASASGLGMSNLPSSSTGPAFGRPIAASSSATTANLAGRYLHTKSDVTIERLDDSMHDSS